MLRKYIRKIAGGLSFTAALFVFQACYGTPQDFSDDVFIEGKVVSSKTQDPIQGIKVSVKELNQYNYTSNTGHFSFYLVSIEKYSLSFEDNDGATNNRFQKFDTLLTQINDGIFLNIQLNEE